MLSFLLIVVSLSASMYKTVEPSPRCFTYSELKQQPAVNGQCGSVHESLPPVLGKLQEILLSRVTYQAKHQNVTSVCGTVS
jgi:hypothetical protein